VAHYGWSAASFFIAACFLTMGSVSGATMFRRWGPEQSGFYPDNEEPAQRKPTTAAAPTSSAEATESAPWPATKLKDFGVAEALKTPSFWFWTVGGVINGLGGTSAFPLFQNLALQEAGISLERAALWYALDFLFTTIGRTGEAA